MKSAYTFTCPQHGKPARFVDNTHYKCPKCYGHGQYVPEGCKVTEYDACHQIELEYRSMFAGYTFSDSTPVFHATNSFLATFFKYPLPVLCLPFGDEAGEFSGMYKAVNGKFGDVRAKIILKPWATIITLIHEFAHHVARVDKLKVKDDFANLHGADFLIVEKMLLQGFADHRKGLINV